MCLSLSLLLDQPPDSFLDQDLLPVPPVIALQDCGCGSHGNDLHLPMFCFLFSSVPLPTNHISLSVSSSPSSSFISTLSFVVSFSSSFYLFFLCLHLHFLAFSMRPCPSHSPPFLIPGFPGFFELSCLFSPLSRFILDMFFSFFLLSDSSSSFYPRPWAFSSLHSPLESFSVIFYFFASPPVHVFRFCFFFFLIPPLPLLLLMRRSFAFHSGFSLPSFAFLLFFSGWFFSLSFIVF